MMETLLWVMIVEDEEETIVESEEVKAGRFCRHSGRQTLKKAIG